MSGKEAEAEEYYHTIEGESGDGSAVPSTLQLALKTVLSHKKQDSVEVVLHLCSMTSNSFSSAVSELLHDNFSSTENQLYRVCSTAIIHIFSPHTCVKHLLFMCQTNS